MKTDGLILDVDGTLWDSTPIVAKAWTRAIRENGITELVVTSEMLRRLFGRTMSVIADMLLPQVEERIRYKIMDDCCAFEHDALEADECKICYEGVQDTIKKLSETTRLFIVSNCQSGYIELFLKKTGLEAFVTDMECFGNTGNNKDENIRAVVERNHLNAPVYVGDTQGDCDAAAKAEVPFVFAAYGFGKADHCVAEIQRFDELLKLTECI